MGARLVCLNGRLVPESEASIPVDDRSFLYGDGLFETLRVYRGKVFAWERHWERMRSGAGLLGLDLPQEQAVLEGFAGLVHEGGLSNGVLRLHVSRGSGERGYAPPDGGVMRWLVTAADFPGKKRSGGERVGVSAWVVPSGDTWSRCKSASRLLQVMGARDARRLGVDEVLMLNERGEVVEGSAANFFWVEGGVVCTPALASGALAGVTRGIVMDLARELGMGVWERALTLGELVRVEQVFLTSSLRELSRVKELEGRRLRVGAEIRALERAYRRRVVAECG